MSPACMDPKGSAAVQRLNDGLRTSFIGGRVMITEGVRDRGQAFESALVEAVQTFADFTQDNDPHGEHDFGSVIIEATRCFWKIDYYDLSLGGHSPDATDPEVTTRVLTIMLAAEY